MRAVPDDARIVAAVRAAVPGARAIWLFGSAVRDQLRAASDLDIAVWTDEPLDGMPRFDAAQHIGNELGRDVDLLDFTRLTPVMQVQILNTGRRLLDTSPGELALVIARIARDYQDLQRWRRPAVEQLARRLAQPRGAAT